MYGMSGVLVYGRHLVRVLAYGRYVRDIVRVLTHGRHVVRTLAYGGYVSEGNVRDMERVLAMSW